MRLPHDKRRVLLEVLEGMFSKLDDFGTFLQDFVGKNLEDIAVGNLTVVRSRVIDRAEEQEWMIDLLEALYETAGPEAREKLDSIGTIEEIREARFHDDCFVDQYPLVDRKDLRKRLRVFAGSEGPRILHVKGARYSGKSHTLLHIRHVAQTLGIPLAEIELSQWATGEDIDPQEIGQAMANAVTLTLPSFDSKAARWAIHFMDWIGAQLAKERKRLWIAFDDFEADKLRYPLPESLYEFILRLAKKVDKTPAMRLFLINYDKTLPSQMGPAIATDHVPDITLKDLGDFFFDFYATQVPDADLTTAEQESIDRARRVYATMNGDPSMRLETMRDALIEECNQILPGGGS